MAIPELQLETWSKQGSIAQSKMTYDTVKNVLNDPKSPYNLRSFDVFLQGSYGNDTNVYADSDVDVVICTDSIFYFDVDDLNEADKATFNREHPGTSQFKAQDFKTEVLEWLRSQYGNAVSDGSKAIFIKGGGGRRDTDVLVCAQYREYFAFPNATEQRRADGIVFFTRSGQKIVNYPKQHSSNCTTKHQETQKWFKPSVRMLKNMRNRMIEDGRIQDGLAPSYFLEGLLYNVPKEKFGSTYQKTFIDCFSWLVEQDRSKFVCANERHWLLRSGSLVSWSSENCDRFIDEAVKFWNGWSA